MTSVSIKGWSPAERPREKLQQSGSSTLTDAELIAIVLRNGTKKQTALDLARLLLSACNNDLMEMGRSGYQQLSRIKGIGPVKAISIVAALELGRRSRFAEARRKEKITCSLDAVNLLNPLLRDLPHEEFWIILLNRANSIIEIRPVSKGGVSATLVDPKIIFHEALQARASGIILSHNHPSSNPKPSESDMQLTKKLKDGGKLLEISILDHIIIAGASFYSFADEGNI
ncbi:MAG: DNA repair protein RadC [Bacteroidetes bacterium]|nr:DNA repair protein RadC [Bacteroidota bacterium]